MFIFLIRLLFLAAIVCLLLVTLTYPNHPPLISLKNALKQKPTENEPRLCCETLEMGNYIRHQTRSLRSKRFRLVSEQGNTKERDFRNESHFSRGLWLSFLVLCFETARKRLLRRLRLLQMLQMESFLVCYQTSQFCPFVVLFLSGCPRGQRAIEKWVASMLKNGQSGGQSPQRVPSPLQWGRLLQEVDGSLQVFWRTNLEVSLERTQT